MSKGIRSNAGPSRMHRSSRRIPVMHRPINPGVMLQRPGEAGMVRGQRREPNRNSATNFIRLSIGRTSSSDGLIRLLHRCMTVRSTCLRKERPFTASKDILDPYRLHQWIRRCAGRYGERNYQRKINGEIVR